LLSNEESIIRNQSNLGHVDKFQNRWLLIRIKNKLKRIKRENKGDKIIVNQAQYLLKLTNDQLKLTRSISIPRIRGKTDL